ncbi:MAG: phenylacetate--CoA ligase [Gammaproteobacteria bacterium]|nr:phenylacetate--CoA ligase [Gammaproteobacteria bacterium]
MNSRTGYEAIENASIDEIRGLQTERLRNTLQYVYRNSPVYRRKFDEAGVRPDDFRSLEDLAGFPFTTKADLRDAYPFGLCCVPMDRVTRIHASSGTTGKPTVVCYSQADIDVWAGLCARSIHAAGGRPGDKVHVAYGYGLFTGGLGAHYGAERLGCAVIPMSGGQTGKQAQLIRDFDPDIIMVTPSYLLHICDEIARQGIEPAKLALRVGILGAEPWTESMRAEIEARMQLDAVDIYGLSEVMGPGVAQECVESKDGATIWEDHFYPEVIDPQTGAVLPDGEQGGLVLTTLTKEAMPVIRYRTRDLTRLLPGTARSMRRMARITGRSDDMLIIRGVNVFPSAIEEQVLSVAGLTPHYLIEVERRRNLDEIKVSVERQAGATPESDILRGELRRRIKHLLGISAQVEIRNAGELPRSQGKAQRVIDRRD